MGSFFLDSPSQAIGCFSQPDMLKKNLFFGIVFDSPAAYILKFAAQEPN
jgi:hypothetical protein